jgi:hypothetical protein
VASRSSVRALGTGLPDRSVILKVTKCFTAGQAEKVGRQPDDQAFKDR